MGVMSGAGGAVRGPAPLPAVTPLVCHGVFVLPTALSDRVSRVGGLRGPLDSHCLCFGDDPGLGNDRKMEKLMKLVLIPHAYSSLSKRCFVLEMRCGTHVPASEQTPPGATLGVRGPPAAWEVSALRSRCGAGCEAVCVCVCVCVRGALCPLEGPLRPLITERLTGRFPVASLRFYFGLSWNTFV